MEDRENSNFYLAHKIEELIADEAEARMGYYELLGSYGGLLSEYETKMVKEIVAEELKHTEMLKRIAYAHVPIAAEK